MEMNDYMETHCARCGLPLPPFHSTDYSTHVEVTVEEDGTVVAVHDACLTDDEVDALAWPD